MDWREKIAPIERSYPRPSRDHRCPLGGKLSFALGIRVNRTCALANTCTHLGGPVAEGSRECDAVTCPWPGSRFDLRSRAVIEGPAVFVQLRLETRVREGKIEVGFPGAAGAELPEIANLEPPPNPA
jgi:nitrite reductase/ring-hydroxylating ferredoxin subunit